MSIIAMNPLADLTLLRHEYDALCDAKAAIQNLDGCEYCIGAFGELDYEITLRRLDKSIEKCRAALRAAEKRYYGV